MPDLEAIPEEYELRMHSSTATASGGFGKAKRELQFVNAGTSTDLWPDSSPDSFSSTGATISDVESSPTTTDCSSGPAQSFGYRLQPSRFRIEDPQTSSSADSWLRRPYSKSKRSNRRRRSEIIPPGYRPHSLPPPPPSPEQLSHFSNNTIDPGFEMDSTSRLALPRCSSRKSLLLENSINSQLDRSDAKRTVQEPIYAEIHKPPRPPKRVCFRDRENIMNLSAIQEVSPLANPPPRMEPLPLRTFRCNSENGFQPAPSPFKSPGRALPKTNPHFALPKNLGTPMRSSVPTRLDQRSQMEAIWSEERVSSYYDSDENSSFASRSSRVRRKKPSSSTAGMHKVLAGLKSFGIKGELYLSVLLNRGLLTVTIDECRHLVAPGNNPANSYVRLSLMPDEEKRTQCRTSLIPRCSQPVFNQNFTVELLPEDYEKRLLVSVWHRDLTTQKSSLLGCMAFTVKHFMQNNKQIDGWYFLLAPSFGRHKHLAVDKVNMLTYYGSVDSGLSTDPSSNQVAFL